ncbi:MAG: hypothetical protein ACREFC_10100, partial [Stellaceae bacterium]
PKTRLGGPELEPARAVVNLPEPTGGAGTDHEHHHPRMPACTKCGEAALIRSEGCDQCTNCDYSKCG